MKLKLKHKGEGPKPASSAHRQSCAWPRIILLNAFAGRLCQWETNVLQKGTCFTVGEIKQKRSFNGFGFGFETKKSLSFRRTWGNLFFLLFLIRGR